MFSADMIQQEMNTWGLEPWGVLVQEDSYVEANGFGVELGLADGSFFVGCLKKEAPQELTQGSHWIDTGYLSFGDAKAGFGFGMFLLLVTCKQWDAHV